MGEVDRAGCPDDGEAAAGSPSANRWIPERAEQGVAEGGV